MITIHSAIASRRPTPNIALSLLSVATLSVLAACGSGTSPLEPSEGASSNDTVATQPPTSEPATDVATSDAPVDTTVQDTTTVPGTNPDDSGDGVPLQQVKGAVVQIEATGTFVDPEFGAQEGAGRGSGFVIDPAGIAVTNNHVVTGAGLLQVYVDGEDEPRNARVLGVSECSDLAVIKIDGPELPALAWSEQPDEPGTEIYVAGFPLGDPEYTLTRGVIAKARANGDTQWASVDHTFEHDAAAQPGNSGGPVIGADGRVAGIHYASATQTNQSQFLAIASDIAQPIVDELTAGNDVDSVGINGQVVVSEDGTTAGLWVSGVRSGSPADDVGIRPGDIVTRVEGVTIGLDGTMKDYCDVLRSHAADDELAVEVLRYDTSEVLEGEFNGDELTQSFSFADEYAGDDATPTGADYDDYMSIEDDSGTITVSVPTAWNDVSGASTDLGDGLASPSIIASPSIAEYNATWTTPGMEFLASPTLTQYTAGELLDLAAPTECTSQGRDDYDDGFFVGQFEVFTDCGATSTQFYVVASTSNDGAYGVLVAVQVVSDADLDALDNILGSFNITV
ncbi:S1C family serine protease [Ilumatobacter nonamiensis]|uniref:S1C family serine protease n=1 Tax=Ilumatobacter nonamiensis TaxID=467093 RepID=UPI0003474727|nr:S1C family serine protease [Ilumatobacter nonamiensis]